jgi:translation elongation factor EF-1alpha
MPLIDKFKDMGTVVMGKIESGSVHRGDTLMIMPNKVGFLIWGHSNQSSFLLPLEM